MLLWIADPTASPLAAEKAVSVQHDAVSSMTLHVPIPVLALREVYNGIHRDLAAQRTATREWIPLGGGTGFLKYRIGAGDQDSRTANGQLISQATFPFGVEYGKPRNGSRTKVADLTVAA